MLIQKNINKIGYYKYETLNDKFSDLVSEYPINEVILNHIKKSNQIKFEFDGDKPKLINDKLIVLV